MNKISMYIPIHTEDNILIRDAAIQNIIPISESIILSYVEYIKGVKTDMYSYPMCKVDIYLNKLDNNDIDFFKSIALSISKEINEPVVCEFHRETGYIATADGIPSSKHLKKR